MKFSVVTPSFNQGNYIERTITSVLQQQGVEFEYVIMDGGSNDTTLTVLSKYRDQLSYYSEPDNGQAHAVNKAIKLTTGEYVGWLNSDDIYYPDALKKVADFFDQHPSVDIVYGKAHQIDAEDQLIAPYPCEAFNFERLKRHCFLSQPATFIRRRAIENHGLLNEKLNFCMDYEYWLRLAKAGVNFAYLPDVLAGTRIYADTKSSRFYLEAHREALNMLYAIFGQIPTAWLINYATAKVKSEQNLQLPHPFFLVKAWQNLWNVIGLHEKGWRRLLILVKAQFLLINKIVVKIFGSISR